MQRKTLAIIGVVIVLAGAAMGLGYGIRAFAGWGGTGRALAVLRERSARLGVMGAAASRAWRGEEPQDRLVAELERLRTELAGTQDLAEENEFLRRVADFPARNGFRAVPGGVYSYAVLGQRLHVVINRGSADGIVPGSTVITETGVLVGIVASQVSAHAADVIVVGDPSLQITGRIAGSPVSGLVRSDASGTLVLDMVGKDEPVTEGMPVVTGGLDRIPAGLDIGTVRTVDSASTTLFQSIRLSASRRERPAGRVLVLVP